MKACYAHTEWFEVHPVISRYIRGLYRTGQSSSGQTIQSDLGILGGKAAARITLPVSTLVASTWVLLGIMASSIGIRRADACERQSLEALQTRASLNNGGDRGAILANPDAIEFPEEQIEAGRVFVAEQNGSVVGFAVILPRTQARLGGGYLWGQLLWVPSK